MTDSTNHINHRKPYRVRRCGRYLLRNGQTVRIGKLSAGFAAGMIEGTKIIQTWTNTGQDLSDSGYDIVGPAAEVIATKEARHG